MMLSFCNRSQPPVQMIEWYQAVALNVDGWDLKGQGRLSNGQSHDLLRR
jgi:hypothetical protein